MLKIRANGIFLNLPDDIQFNLIIDNAFMLVNRIPSPFALSFDVALTPPNLKAFNYPNRIAVKEILGEVPGEIYFDDVKIDTGFFKVENCKTTINISYRGSSFDDNFLKQLNNVEMQRYDFGPGNAYETNPTPGTLFGQFAANFFTLIEAANANPDSKFVVAPIKTSGPTSFPSQFIQNNTYINAYDAYYHRWYKHGRNGGNSKIYPLPYLHYVIDTIFGGYLTENPFKEGDLKKLVLFTSHHPNSNLNVGSFILDSKFPYLAPLRDGAGKIIRNTVAQPVPPQYFTDTYFKLNSFCSTITVSELLKDLLKIICASLYPDKGKWKIVTNKSIIQSTEVENWSAKLIEVLSNNLLESKSYQFSYADNKQKVELPEDRVELSSISAMRSENVVDFPDGANIFITSTKQLFKKKFVDDKNSYELLDSGLGGLTSESEEPFELSSKVQPLPMNIGQYFYRVGARDEFFKDWYLPHFDGTVEKPSDRAYIMFFHGLKSSFVPADTYPYLTPFNYDHLGNRIGDISLAYDGADGIGNLYHQDFKNWIEKKKLKISGLFRLSALDLKSLDLTIKKNINGRNFYIKKIQLTITKNEIKPAFIDFIEA